MTTPMPEAVEKTGCHECIRSWKKVASTVDFVFSAVNMPKEEIKALKKSMQRQRLR